jgi:CRP/FNR family transcriptional regulator, anaerobic regulatory protein
MVERGHELLRLGREALCTRFQAGAVRVLRAGQLLVVGAKPNEILYRVRAGWAYRFRNLRNGAQAIVGVYLPGDIIGICNKEASNIRMLTTTAVEVISGEQGLVGLMTSSETAAYIYQLLNDRQQRADRLLASIVSLDAQGRMAAMVLDFYWRLEVQKLIIASSFHLPMTQYHIGNFLGVTSVHVNRVISALRDAGIVNIEKHHVTIFNLSQLAELANADLKSGCDPNLVITGDPVAPTGGEQALRAT